MTEIDLTDSTLRVHIRGIDQFLSFRKEIDVPLTHVVGAAVGIEKEAELSWQSLRIPGAALPGLVLAGSYLQFRDKYWLFYNIRRGERAITITLAHEHYAALVVEVDDPEGTVAAINAAVGARRGA